jgi:hypothetical protein
MAEINLQLNTKTGDVVNHLFKILKSIYPAYKYSWATDEDFLIAKREWTRALADEGIRNVSQIRLGIAKARRCKNPYVPSVGQFISWCKQSSADMGLVSVEEGFRIASMNSHPCASHIWPDGVSYEAWRRTGPYNMRSKPEKDVFPIFKKNYENPIKAKASKKTADKNLANIRRILGEKLLAC